MTAPRSVLFLVWMIALCAVMFLLCLPLLVLPRRFCVVASRIWARLILWGLGIFAGVRYRLRGDFAATRGPVLVAAKHYSMWETVVLLALLPDPAMVLKRELMRIPFYGWYTRKLEMIPIDRAGRARSLKIMLQTARHALKQNRPIGIFPEGTRKEIGAPPDYKPGVAGLYAQLGVACVPIAHNSGLFWTGFLKRPGTITIEVLAPIPPGLPRAEFQSLLESRIEQACARLIAAP
jgi:1-acyl-sn-glycerol-3-phosphate acyltransferase